jgi:hypothetical protein
LIRILIYISRIDLFIDEKRINGFSLENVNFIPEEQLESRLNFIKKDYSSIDVNFNNLNYFILKILQKNKFNINNQKNIILQFMMQKNPQEIQRVVFSSEESLTFYVLKESFSFKTKKQ